MKVFVRIFLIACEIIRISISQDVTGIGTVYCQYNYDVRCSDACKANDFARGTCRSGQCQCGGETLPSAAATAASSVLALSGTSIVSEHGFDLTCSVPCPTPQDRAANVAEISRQLRRVETDRPYLFDGDDDDDDCKLQPPSVADPYDREIEKYTPFIINFVKHLVRKTGTAVAAAIASSSSIYRQGYSSSTCPACKMRFGPELTDQMATPTPTPTGPQPDPCPNGSNVSQHVDHANDAHAHAYAHESEYLSVSCAICSQTFLSAVTEAPSGPPYICKTCWDSFFQPVAATITTTTTTTTTTGGAEADAQSAYSADTFNPIENDHYYSTVPPNLSSSPSHPTAGPINHRPEETVVAAAAAAAHVEMHATTTYVCSMCGHTYDDDDKTELVAEGGRPPYVCPKCWHKLYVIGRNPTTPLSITAAAAEVEIITSPSATIAPASSVAVACSRCRKTFVPNESDNGGPPYTCPSCRRFFILPKPETEFTTTMAAITTSNAIVITAAAAAAAASSVVTTTSGEVTCSRCSRKFTYCEGDMPSAPPYVCPNCWHNLSVARAEEEPQRTPEAAPVSTPQTQPKPPPPPPQRQPQRQPQPPQPSINRFVCSICAKSFVPKVNDLVNGPPYVCEKCRDASNKAKSKIVAATITGTDTDIGAGAGAGTGIDRSRQKAANAAFQNVCSICQKPMSRGEMSDTSRPSSSLSSSLSSSNICAACSVDLILDERNFPREIYFAECTDTQLDIIVKRLSEDFNGEGEGVSSDVEIKRLIDLLNEQLKDGGGTATSASASASASASMNSIYGLSKDEMNSLIIRLRIRRNKLGHESGFRITHKPEYLLELVADMQSFVRTEEADSGVAGSGSGSGSSSSSATLSDVQYVTEFLTHRLEEMGDDDDNFSHEIFDDRTQEQFEYVGVSDEFSADDLRQMIEFCLIEEQEMRTFQTTSWTTTTWTTSAEHFQFEEGHYQVDGCPPSGCPPPPPPSPLPEEPSTLSNTAAKTATLNQHRHSTAEFVGPPSSSSSPSSSELEKKYPPILMERIQSTIQDILIAFEKEQEQEQQHGHDK